jgi:two-component system, NtrC family, nitrogen regulation sensor histidine kinase GlnL
MSDLSRTTGMAPHSDSDLNLGEQRWSAFDLLATMIAIVEPSGTCVHVNTACEDTLAVARRSLVGTSLCTWFVDANPIKDTLAAVARNDYGSAKLEAQLRRLPHLTHPAPGDALPVHVVVQQVDRGELLLVQMLEFEQQWRQDRDARTLEQARENKELIRHLAHEIKNPLGGIRGSAQLLGLELAANPATKALTDYTQVVVREADRLQTLVDRLLAPHRVPHVVGDVNIHEVCERVRALLLAEFPQGLKVVRDYDTSIPEFRGDSQALIQATLNIAHNAALALHERVAAGDAVIVLRTRVARQVTIGKRRWRLALDLQVEDNGPGILDAIRDRIFLPLVSGREGGTGLGLTLTQHFVQQHDGLVECESTPGRTVFKIVMPLP